MRFSWRGVTKCVYNATISLDGAEVVGEPVGEPGQIGVVGRSGATSGVFVETTDSADASANRAFRLVVDFPVT